MPAAHQDLAQIQGWMQSVIMNPSGVVDDVAASDARSQINVSPEEIETVIERSSHQTSIERLQIYSRAYYARLLECLRAEYPVMAKAMGTELFDEFAVEYLQRYPPHSYTLNELGASFATFLAETRPTSTGEDDSWLDFLVDLAKLEWCFAEVFDGPGAENQRLLGPDQLQAISMEHWPKARLVPVPCLRILRLDFPVHEYYRTVRDGTEAVPPVREPTQLAISRRNYVVRHMPLTASAAAILEAIVAGATVGDALERAARTADIDQLADAVQRGFYEWTVEGFFLTAELDHTSSSDDP